MGRLVTGSRVRGGVGRLVTGVGVAFATGKRGRDGEPLYELITENNRPGEGLGRDASRLRAAGRPWPRRHTSATEHGAARVSVGGESSSSGTESGDSSSSDGASNGDVEENMAENSKLRRRLKIKIKQKKRKTYPELIPPHRSPLLPLVPS